MKEFLVIFGVFGSVFCGLLFLINETDKSERHHLQTCIVKTVKTVGGCDKYGECGIIFEDGTTYRANYPVAGGTTCSN